MFEADSARKIGEVGFNSHYGKELLHALPAAVFSMAGLEHMAEVAMNWHRRPTQLVATPANGIDIERLVVIAMIVLLSRLAAVRAREFASRPKQTRLYCPGYNSSSTDAALRTIHGEHGDSHLRHHPRFFGLSAGRTARIRLNIVTRRDSFDAVAPDVGTKFGEREARVVSDNALAKLGARFSRPARAQVQVVDLGANGRSECFALGGLRVLEKGAKVHVATNRSECGASIDQKDLHNQGENALRQIFLHVDQND
jgi:hypothetical protein